MRILTTPTTLLKLEAAVLLAVIVVLFARFGGSWWLFAALFLAPDLGAIGYLRGPRAGAACYNLTHIFVLPGLLLAFAWSGSSLALDLALIWGAHLAFDRAIGYGLKLPSAFNETHLGRIGRDRSRSS